ncbi:restriction endonuclease subunit S [Lachnospiraceae bacterium DSM 108991]|uniref:Restriction endonuclease subunit S n=1 Tax=Claveliimonas monacensis TaxID=2779351 RepID=A0ABR9RL36_9FIRM|nr:restriction endonuclease subunit S [Claveliimonas monacensis]MBE5063689.1 restriction endonuclease subunit S [Claveliimonas monacensis]
MGKPEIRFKGFTDDWEQRKLGEVIEDYVEKTTVENQYPVLTSSQQMGIVLQDDYFSGDRVSQSGNIGYFVIPRGYFAYRSRSDNDVFVFNRNDCIDKGSISYFYPVFKPSGVDSDFLLRRLNYGLETQLKIASEGTGQHVLSLKKFKNMTALFPSINEQRKIGEYFTRLDHLITLHQRKCDEVKTLKKYMLQKMFPQNGINVPEIRFSGFTDVWEQRKLGEMGSTFTGLSGKTKEDFGHGDAKFITYMNVFSNPIADLQMTETVEIDSKQNCVKAGDVFFTTSSETPEEVGMSCVMPENADNTYLNSFCFGYRPTEKFDLNYLAYVLRSESFRKEMTFLAQGISRYNISKNKVMEVEIPVPSLEEQSKVGRYFSNLDNLITLHQRKCNELRKMKKFMLQNMFPKD